MADGSLVVRCCRGAAGTVMRQWRASRTAGLLARMGRGIRRVGAGSGLVRFLGRNGHVSRAVDGSFPVAGLEALAIDLPKTAGRALAGNRILGAPSVVGRVLAYLAGKLHILTGLFLAVVLLAPHERWNNLYSMCGVAVLMLLLIFREAVTPEPQMRIRSLGSWMLLYVVFVVLACITSVYLPLSARFLAFHLTNFMLVLLLVSSVRSRDDLTTLLEILLLAVSASSLVGIVQGIRGVPVNVAEIDTTLNDTATGRVYGLYDNSNNFAEILLLFLPFYAGQFFASKGWRRRIFFMLAALPPLLSMVLTQSRSSWGGLALAMCVFACFLNWRLIPVAAIAGLAAFPFMPLTIRQRVLSAFNPADSSMAYRIKIWNTMGPVIRDYWWTGLGLGNDAVMKIVANYSLQTKGVPLHCHNVFLQTWIETGILGLLSLLGFLGQTFKRGIRAARALGRTDALRWYAVAGISSLAGILLTSMMEYTWFYPRVMLSFWCVAGLSLAAASLAEEKDGRTIWTETA